MSTIEIKTQKPITPLQRRIIEAVKSSEYDTVVVKSGRQVSKTTTAILCALHWCMNEQKRVGFFAPVFRQCRKVIDQMERALGGATFATYNKSDMSVSFSNGSYIKFFSADGEIRGFTFDAIIIDEASFIPDEVYHSEIFATVGVAMSEGRGKQLIISTPKSRNWFYTKCMIEDDKKCVITATTLEGGLWNADIIEKLRKETPEHIFRNEYLAEFLEEGTGVFEYKKCIKEKMTDNAELYIAGLDFGIEGDYTVLAIMNELGELVHLQRWKADDWQSILKSVASVLKKYNATCYAETNGIGNMPAKELRKLHPSTNFWTTTNKTKVDIIQKLSYSFSNADISIPNDKVLLNELDAYTLEYTPKTGKVTYNARGGFNDDCVMALAIANWHRPRVGSIMM